MAENPNSDLLRFPDSSLDTEENDSRSESGLDLVVSISAR